MWNTLLKRHFKSTLHVQRLKYLQFWSESSKNVQRKIYITVCLILPTYKVKKMYPQALNFRITLRLI